MPCTPALTVIPRVRLPRDGRNHARIPDVGARLRTIDDRIMGHLALPSLDSVNCVNLPPATLAPNGWNSATLDCVTPVTPCTAEERHS